MTIFKKRNKLIFDELFYGMGITHGKRNKKYYVKVRGNNIIKKDICQTEEEAKERAIELYMDIFCENVLSYNVDKLNDIVSSSEYGYFVSPKGNIYNKKGQLLKKCIGSRGYYTIRLNSNKTIDYHRIVAQTFIPNPDNLPEVNHIDGDKLNNNVNNLEWCTYSYNMKHAYNHGLKNPPRGELSGKHKLTNEDIEYIKTHYDKLDKNFSSSALAKKFNVHKTTILRVIKGETWKNVV